MDLKSTDLNDLVACHECDIVSSVTELKDGYELACVRCGAKVYERKKNSIDRSLAISFAGIVLMIPAYFTQIVGIEAAGLSNDATLFDCIDILLASEYYIVAILIFLFTVAATV